VGRASLRVGRRGFGGAVGLTLGMCLVAGSDMASTARQMETFFIGGSLIGAILCAAVFVMWPRTSTGEEPGQQGSMPKLSNNKRE